MFNLNVKANNIKDAKRIVSQVSYLIKILINNDSLLAINRIKNIDNITNIESFIQTFNDVQTVVSIIYEIRDNDDKIAHVFFNQFYKYTVKPDEVFNLDVKTNSVCDLDKALTEYTLI